MRLPTVILFFALVLVSVSASLRAGASISTVNALVGDRSAEYFERGPSLEGPSLEGPSREDPSLEDPSLGRDERIARDLSFVLERLRKRSARCLDGERARRRTARLDDLERYVTQGSFLGTREKAKAGSPASWMKMAVYAPSVRSSPPARAGTRRSVWPRRSNMRFSKTSTIPDSARGPT